MTTGVIKFEAKFDGINWTDITSDVVLSAGVHIKYGITSGKMEDRVADVGTMRIALNNSISNSGGVNGYYTPGHTNCRGGFGVDLKIRMQVTSGAVTRTKFYGTIPNDAIMPSVGQYGERRVYVTVNDWMRYPAETELGNIAYKAEQDISGVVGLIAEAMPVQPLHTDYSIGLTRFDAIYDPVAGNLRGLTELVRAANSEFGYIYVRHDETHDEVLRVENRHSRNQIMFSDSPLYEFDNDMSGGNAEMGERYKEVTFRVYPRREDASPVVLHRLDKRISLVAGETSRFSGRYTDPSNKSSSISARSVEAMVSGTDYIMTANQDGTGANLTSDLDVTISTGANTILYTLENTGSANGYVYVQCRGIGIYGYDPVDVSLETAWPLPEPPGGWGSFVSPPAGEPRGKLSMDMRYQDDPREAHDILNYLMPKLLWSSLVKWKSVVFYPNRNAGMMTAFLAGDVGDHVQVTEHMSGAAGKDYFVNGVEIDVLSGGIIQCKWHLMWDMPPRSAYWLLEVTGRTELGLTTVLAP